MNDKDLDARLDRLKVGYDQLEERTDVDHVINTLKPKPSKKHAVKKRAWHIPLISAAAIAIMFGLGNSLMTDDAVNSNEQQESTETQNSDFDYKWFTAELKSRYESLEEQQFEKSGLTREQFYSLPSVGLAKQMYNRYMSGSWEEANGRSEKEFLDYIMQSLQEELYAPRELVEQKITQFERLPLDMQMSQSLLLIYSWRYQEYERAKSEGGMILSRIDQADRDLLEKVLDPLFAPILDFYAFGPMTNGADIIVDVTELPALFVPLEPAYSSDVVTIQEDKSDLATLLFISAKGTMSSNLEDQQAAVFENGKVKKEYRETWIQYAEQPEYTLSAQIFRPIVEEMEQTNWTKSEAWVQFDFQDAIAHLDNLDNGYYQAEDAESTLVKVDADFMSKIHAYFKTLSLRDSSDKYIALSPQEIVGLYYYYWHFGKIELQYEMYIDDERFMQIPWEEYKKGYQPFKWPFDQFAESLNFIDHGLDEYDMHTGVVQIQLKEEARNGSEEGILSFQVVKTDEGWKMPFMPTQ